MVDRLALHEISIAAAGELLRSGNLSSVDLTRYSLERIDALDHQVHSFVTVTRERALEDAAAADADFAAGVDRGPLQGIPYGLKDMYDTAGAPNTCQSKLLLGNVAGEDSEVAARLRSGGAVLLGKMSTYEFAIGGPSFDLPSPPSRNPWNTDCIPGGSSSGAGAAVAAGICRLAMGTDTAGSIRYPAGACGAVGLKPTYGLVSRRGVFPLSYSLDHCGPITWSVEDCAIAMEVVAGHDALDPSSADIMVPQFRREIDWGVQGLRIGVPRHFFESVPGVSRETVHALDDAIELLACNGAKVENARLPDYDLFNAVAKTLQYAEAYAIHERNLRTRPQDYGRIVRMRLTLGAFLSAADLVHAMRLRRELTESLNRGIFREFDALITVNTFGPAIRFDEASISPSPPMQPTPFNVTGNPALAMPTGLSSSGLPLSLQIVGRLFDEPMVVRIGAMLERLLGPKRRPQMANR
ncbi:MAG: amidase [Burkholderiaceae bacterium]|nr:amidase [Burkholderiaceae bacterium]